MVVNNTFNNYWEKLQILLSIKILQIIQLIIIKKKKKKVTLESMYKLDSEVVILKYVKKYYEN